eukprot:m.62475 g.62475  ORF g.62475 m.62475 type:complete len:1711 (+) comp7137_c2_seq6:34-5166(+)
MVAVGKLQQIRLLVWKNFVLQKRRPIGSIVEILLPVLFFLVMAFVRFSVKASTTQELSFCSQWVSPLDFQRPLQSSNMGKSAKTSQGFGECSQYINTGVFEKYTAIGYAPATANVRTVMAYVSDAMSSLWQSSHRFNYTFVPFNTSDQIENLNNYGSGFLAGIVFAQQDGTLGISGNKITYQLRMQNSLPNSYGGGGGGGGDSGNNPWNTNKNTPQFQQLGPINNPYSGTGFLILQSAIDYAITAYLADDVVTDFVPRVKPFPYPSYLDDGFIFAISNIFPLLLIISHLYTAVSIVRSIVLEKERRLKEAMKMMGLSNAVLWFSWFLKCFLFSLVTVIGITVIWKVGNLVSYSDSGVIFVFLLLFAVSTILWCFMVSAFFSRASVASAAGGLIFFMGYFPYFFIQRYYGTMSDNEKAASCLLSPTCIGIGATLIAIFEARGEGLTFSNLTAYPNDDDSFTMAKVFGMLILDCVLYIIITWYVEAVYPGANGMPQPPWFCFTRSYWCSTSPDKSALMEDDDGEYQMAFAQENFEADPKGRAGVQLRNLRKVYNGVGGRKVAVDNLNLNIFDGQITVLLGHNGAGKTTTMSILTGLYPPTRGTAVVGGYDIRDSIAQVQQTLGICPQHDVLFDSLTVAEHLWFFCRLKGVPAADVPDQINTMIKDLELEDKRHVASTRLSGGMKRKLSTGIALIGGSKVVILDEPTSGMDPSARRATWDLISKYKTGRTILLSTHFMDEADLLGDRVAIMADGVVKCAGTTLFLKGRYGVGYHLTIVKARDPMTQADLCRLNQLTSLVKEHVPDAELVGNVGAELTFILPREASSHFAKLFQAMEADRATLGIESFGASVTTMEEVFLKVGETGVDAEHIDIQSRIETSKSKLINGRHEEDGLLAGATMRNSGVRLARQQFYALIVKRALYSIRNKSAIITQLALPMIFCLIALIVTKTLPGPEDSPSRELNNLVENYGQNTYSYYATSNVTIYNVTQVMGQYGRDQLLAQSSTPDMADFLLAKAGRNSRDVAYFNKVFLAAATLNNVTGSYIAWFNDMGYHTSAESLAAATNIILGRAGLAVYTDNHPLPRTLLEQALNNAQDPQGFTLSFNILFGMAFCASSFVLFLVAERANKAKHIQFVSGVNALSYWGSAFLWDYFNYLISVASLLILFAAFSIAEFTGERLLYVLLQFLLYGLAILPLMYLASFLFMVTSTAYARLTMFNVVTGLAGLLTVSIFAIINPSTADTLKSVFVFLPNFAFGQGISDIYTNYDNQDMNPTICTQLYNLTKDRTMSLQECCDSLVNDPRVNSDQSCQVNYLAWEQPGIGKYLVVMLIEAIVLFGLVILIEMRVFSRFVDSLQRMGTTVPGRSAEHEDQDVATERLRVSQSTTSDVLVVRGLRKIYHLGMCTEPKLAVDGISFGVPRGECFGLLGVNGAGKTTTFGMLTGDLTVSEGTAAVEGHSILTDMRKVRQRLGYCPQFDGLIDLMTGREVLTMYARLRGVQEHEIPYVVSELIESLMLEKHADKHTVTYSGGNKRKLSTAIALIGDPAIVFLDEPTTGMDPGARRFLWDRINATVREGRSIILTSHSLEECEALCTRLAIMVNGRFQCIGSPQHLKSRFGRGFSMTARVPGGRGADTKPLKQFLASRLPDCSIKEEHQGYVKFVVGQGIGLARLFELFEEAKQTINLEDYSVSQTSLEQVFLDFAKHQIEDMRQSRS